MFNTRFITSFIILGLALGCSDGGNSNTGDAGVMPFDASAQAYLTIIGSTVVSTPVHSELELTVRYSDAAGNPIQGQVSFAIEGDAAGASLEQFTVTSNAEGFAAVRLRAGEEANFPVVARAPLANEPVAFTVTVTPIATADLTVTPRYTGERVMPKVEVALYTNYTCTQLATMVPTPRMMGETMIDTPEKFELVDVDIPLAIFAFGINEQGNIAAYRCLDHVLDRNTELDISLTDVEAGRAGRYSTVETFDVTAGFNSDLDNTLDALTGLTTDPAAYILDRALEAADLPDWADLILSAAPVREQVEGAINEAISDIHVPEEIVAIAETGADLDRAFSELVFIGELDLGEPGEFGDATATHTLTEVRIPTDDGYSSYPLTGASQTVGVQFGEEIVIDEHSFEIAFGDLVEGLLDHVLLPRLPGAPHGVDQFLSGLVDCEGLGDRIDDELASSVAQVACEVGVMMVGERIDEYVNNLWDYSTLTLDARGDVTDANVDYVADGFAGTADANWAGESGELDFTGTIDGARLDDVAPNQATRIWQRMHDTLD